MCTVRCTGSLPGGRGGGYLPGEVGCTPPPCGQTDTCENNLSATTVADGKKGLVETDLVVSGTRLNLKEIDMNEQLKTDLTWFLLMPHVHHAYNFPASNSILKGFLSYILPFGLSKSNSPAKYSRSMWGHVFATISGSGSGVSGLLNRDLCRRKKSEYGFLNEN